MHVPTLYKNENISEVKDFLVGNSFGILVTQSIDRPIGTHIPMELDKDENGNDILLGHISKANPQWNSFRDDQEVLAIFSGPHSYISSSWYEEENVPTWNYIAVHVYGSIKLITGDVLVDSLRKLVDKYEVDSEDPVSVDKMSPKTMQQINGIIGFSINITEIQVAYKLSQNRNDSDYHNIIDKLENSQNPLKKKVAKEMKKKR